MFEADVARPARKFAATWREMNDTPARMLAASQIAQYHQSMSSDVPRRRRQRFLHEFAGNRARRE